jgi:ATP-binding cassette subfamily F protein uup
VSHDRAFLDNVVTSTLVFEGAGRVNEYVGGYSDWLRQRRALAVGSRAPSPGRATPPAAGPPASKSLGPKTPAPKSASPKPPAPKPRKLPYKDQRELDGLPELIQRLERTQAELAATIGDPELHRRSPEHAASAAQRLLSVQQQLEAAFARWEALEAAGKPSAS